MNRHPRRFGRSWTVTDLVLLTAGIVTILVGLLAAQLPPLPPGSTITKTVTIAWDANPASDYYYSTDTNGVPVPLTYFVRMATNIATPHSEWTVLATTTNTTATVSNLVAANLFFTVTASNFFLESEPSRPVAIPFDPPDKLRLIVE